MSFLKFAVFFVFYTYAVYHHFCLDEEPKQDETDCHKRDEVFDRCDMYARELGHHNHAA